MSTNNPGAQAPRNTNNNNVTTIDLVEVFSVLWHWMWLLLLVALICGTAGYCFSRFVLPEEYTSTTKIYILNKSDATANGTLNYSDLQAGSQLTNDYAELITSHDVLDKVIEDLQLPYSYETLVGKITVTIPTDTRIVSIAVTDTDPHEAQLLAEEVRNEASEHIKNVMDLDAVNIAEKATLPTHKSAPSNSRWAIVSALIGFLVVAAVLIIQYLMDDTLRTPDDVQKFLEMSTLSQIPSDLEVTGSEQDTRKGKRRKHRGRKKSAAKAAKKAPARSASVSAAPSYPSQQERTAPASESRQHVEPSWGTPERREAPAKAAPVNFAAEERRERAADTGRGIEAAGDTAVPAERPERQQEESRADRADVERTRQGSRKAVGSREDTGVSRKNGKAKKQKKGQEAKDTREANPVEDIPDAAKEPEIQTIDIDWLGLNEQYFDDSDEEDEN